MSLIVRCIGPTFSITIMILCVFDAIFSVSSEHGTLKDSARLYRGGFHKELETCRLQHFFLAKLFPVVVSPEL